MAKYNCKENDHIAKVAAAKDFYNWKTLWNANQGLGRANPDILYGGDQMQVPDKKVKEFSCKTDLRHVFKVPRCKLFLRVRILKEDFTPVQRAAYELEFHDNSKLGLRTKRTFLGKVKRFTADDEQLPLKGETDDNGQIERQIPIYLETAVLTVRVKAEDTDRSGAKKPKGVRGSVPIMWNLQVGRLDPIKEEAPDKDCRPGVQQRLNNLAINAGEIDGTLNPQAVAVFQKLYKIAETEGQPGTNTQGKLYDVHDGPSPVLPP